MGFLSVLIFWLKDMESNVCLWLVFWGRDGTWKWYWELCACNALSLEQVRDFFESSSAIFRFF
jgi:hypothetical protein